MMKTRLFLLVTALCLLSFTPLKGQKVQSSFWECSFGMTNLQVKEVLAKTEMKTIEGKSGNIYLQNVTLDAITYKTVCMVFSPIDGNFYRLIGSNEFSSKAQADSCYEAELSLFRGKYEKLQIIRHPENAVKMCTYLDDDNAFYLGFFKKDDENGKALYYVNTNFWNKYADKRIQESKQ